MTPRRSPSYWRGRNWLDSGKLENDGEERHLAAVASPEKICSKRFLFFAFVIAVQYFSIAFLKSVYQIGHSHSILQNCKNLCKL